MLVTLEERRESESATIGGSSIQAISTRLAGGRRDLKKELSKV